MQAHITSGEWATFDDHYFAQCSAHAPELATEIRRADLNLYLDTVSEAFDKSLPIALEREFAAIYFEYDLDNDWESNIFLCPEYKPIESDDDDWACDFELDLPAGSQSDFANIYATTDNFCQTDAATDTTLFLIARTAILLNNVIANRDLGPINICIGFHDQNPIHRLRSAT